MPAPAQCCRAGAGRSTAVDLSSSGASASAVTVERDTQRRRASRERGRDARARRRRGRRGACLRAREPAGSSPGYGSAPLLRDAVFSPDGKSVFTGDANGVIIRWDARAALGSREPTMARPIRDLAVSPDGRLRRLGCRAGGARVARRRRESGCTAAASLLGRARLLRALPGASCSTVARDARVFDARDWGRPPLLLDQTGERSSLPRSLRPEDCVATGGRDDLAMIWDAGDGTPLHQLPHRGERARRRMVAERQPARDGEHGQRRPNLPDRDRRARDVPRRALEPGGRRRVQPGRDVDRDCLARRIGTHLGRRRLRTLGRAARPLGRCARRGVHTGRRKRRHRERRRLRPGVEAGGRPNPVASSDATRPPDERSRSRRTGGSRASGWTARSASGVGTGARSG